jgi:hypothetical protein
VKTVFSENGSVGDFVPQSIDPRIGYPCYKSFDEFIDLDRLRSLDDYLTERIERHLKTEQHSYFVNQHRLDETTPFRPGVREIWLSRTKPGVPYDYFDLNRSGLWQLTKEANEFTLLMEFIETLPFQSKGRILIIYDDSGKAVPSHRDHLNTGLCHEFVWFRTNLKKPFYVLNECTGEKKYVESYSAWFDSVNQFHGSDGCDGLSFSIRVDGEFTDDFRALIPRPATNPASTPAFWAAVDGERAARRGMKRNDDEKKRR